VELYRDRAEGDWPRTPEGDLAMMTGPLDLLGLMAELGG
jgi:catechol 2,3-dioxygenase